MSRPSNVKVAEEVGRILYHRGNFLGKGRFGTVFRGKFESKFLYCNTLWAVIQSFVLLIDILDVAVKRLERRSARVDMAILNKVGFHANVLRYQGSEDNGDVEYM